MSAPFFWSFLLLTLICGFALIFLELRGEDTAASTIPTSTSIWPMDDRKVFKRSQRPTWSCTECVRKKVKCDKVIPCQPCIRRGAQHLCMLDHDGIVVGSSLSYDSRQSSFTPMPASPDAAASLNAVVRHLQSTVHHLERRLAVVEDATGSGSSSSIFISPTSASIHHSPASSSRTTLDHPESVVKLEGVKSEGVADAAQSLTSTNHWKYPRRRSKGATVKSNTS
jgi:hypothetical protein